MSYLKWLQRIAMALTHKDCRPLGIYPKIEPTSLSFTAAMMYSESPNYHTLAPKPRAPAHTWTHTSADASVGAPLVSGCLCSESSFIIGLG